MKRLFRQHPLKYLKSVAKHKTTKLNSLYEPRTDSVLEVQNGHHVIDISSGFEKPEEVNHGNMC